MSHTRGLSATNISLWQGYGRRTAVPLPFGNPLMSPIVQIFLAVLGVSPDDASSKEGLGIKSAPAVLRRQGRDSVP